jgi:CRISPR-associated endonuclease Cas1
MTVTRLGICLLDGYGVKVSVERGQLVVRDGIGRTRREGRFARATCDIRRLVVIGHTGFVTLDAIRWLHDVGAVLLHLDPDGRELISSAGLGLDEPRLRRAQAAAYGTELGTKIGRDLLRQKLLGQLRVADRLGATEAIVELHRATEALTNASTPAELMVPEAAGAQAYWRAWAPVELRWARADSPRVPDYWRDFGGRASSLTGNPRQAANPANAMLNYLYSLLEAAARLSCLAIGLDPGLGWLHSDLRARDSAALDVMEAARPDIDEWLYEFLMVRTFRRTDFVETRQGQCRILAPLAHELAATLPTWERRLAPIVEGVARAIANGRDSRVRRLPTLLTSANRSAGRDAQRVGAARKRAPLPSIKRMCRTCGEDAPTSARDFCDLCLPDRITEQRVAAREAAVDALARARVDGTDRSHGGSAAASRGRKVADARRQAAVWRQSNRPLPDDEVFRRDILPVVRRMSARRLGELTGLSRPYCSAIVRGDRIPHPRWWNAIRATDDRLGET